MSQLLSDLYPPYPSESGGFNWTTDNEVTTDQTPTTANLGQRYAFTQSTATDRTVTLPSVGASEDGKWFVIYNASQYTITITASDSDTIGWPALSVTSAEILANTEVVVRYNHANTKWDIPHKAGGQLRPSGTKMYLRCDRSNLYYDSGTAIWGAIEDETNKHTLTNRDQGNAHTLDDPLNSKFGPACVSLSGTTSSYQSSDSTDWDIFGSTTTDVTISLWAYFDAGAAYEPLLGQYEDGSNRWILQRDISGKLQVYMVPDGLLAQGGSMSVNTWYHCAMVKIGEDVATYINGTQVGWDTGFTPDTFTTTLNIGNESTTYTDGRMDDIAIVYHNIFGAAPNVGVTDTITIDTLNPLGLVL